MAAEQNIDAEHERAAFEASGITGRLYRNATPGGTDYYEDSHTEMAWRAWQERARRSAAIGEGNPVEFDGIKTPEFGGIGESGLPQAAQGVKTWQERMTEAGGSGWVPHSFMVAEIADLRAQLASQSQGMPTDAQIIAALHANGIDTYPSKYGFDAVQISATSVPGLRKVLETLAAPLLSSEQQATKEGK
jgi:hypothetical protein